MPILHWLDRDKHIAAADNVPYRLLEADDALSEGHTETPNMLIQGDNLEALKALLPYYAGRVKCIFIDPPYNTRSAFEHYDDNLEHTQWLALMFPRLQLLNELLADEGSMWVTIDDNEGHYLKVVMDEVFGRKNFVANVIWQKRTSPDARIDLGPAHDHVMVYAKSVERARFNKLVLSTAQASNFKNPDNDPAGHWVSTDFTAQGWRPNQMYKITTPSGAQYEPPEGRCWGNIEPEFLRLKSEGRIWFGVNGSSRPRLKNYLSDASGIRSWTWWPNTEVGHNQEAKKEINDLFGAANAFDTPKPERLIQRILQIATKNGDLVLDSFLGSGTTAAVAHKMGPRYIGIETGDHAVTHCVPRLKKVIKGEQGGISEAVQWKGGGGFRFHRLGPSVFDAEGRVNPQIRFAHLAAHIWFSETHTALHKKAHNPLLGIHNNTAFYLLYNGILGDKRPDGGNVLTAKTLAELPKHNGQKIIYGEACGSALPV
jgi:adenine-specific DNA-methyltransferase